MPRINSTPGVAGGVSLLAKRMLALLLLLPILPLSAGDTLLFWEAQMVGAYDGNREEFQLYSHYSHHAMQKPSMGFGLIKRFGSEYGDWGILALQYRVAYQNEQRPRFASQLYNAYFKAKTEAADIWMGSNKPALGLSYRLDNHAALLSDMTSRVFTYDRDWGIGAEKDYGLIKPAISITNGSGMRLYNKKGNYLLAGRLGIGNYEKSNYNLGISTAHGKVLEAMGYTLGHPDSQTGEYPLHGMSYLGVDGAWRYRNYEWKTDLLAGEFYHEDAYAAMLRGTVNLMDEDKLKLEGQILHSLQVKKDLTNYAAAVAYQITPDIALRTMADYNVQDENWRFVAQIYFYKPFSP